MRAIREKLLFQFCQHLLWGSGMLRQWFSEELRQCAWFDIREHWLFFDVLQILGQHIHDAVPNFAKFFGIHEST
jgi:hypothetical protein